MEAGQGVIWDRFAPVLRGLVEKSNGFRTAMEAFRSKISGRYFVTCANVRYPLEMVTLYKVLQGQNVDNLNIIGVVFDGNVEGNPHTHSWRANPSVVHGGSGLNILCSEFKNNPAENIVGHDLTLTHSTGHDLYGSFVHFSSVGGGQVLIENVSTFNTNQSGQVLSGHSEGVLTFSNDSGDVVVRDSTFTKGGESAWGSQGVDDCDVTAINTVFDSFKSRYYNPPQGCLNDEEVSYIDTPEEE